MPRKRSSWGCVQRMDKDRYRIRYWADLGDGYSRHTLTVHGTRREAEAKLAELRTRHEVEPDQPRRRAYRMTIGEVWDAWVRPDMEARLSNGSLAKTTWANSSCTWRKHVAPRWADVRCAEVEPVDVQEWLLTMTASSAKYAKMLLAQILSKGVMFHACQTNPADMRYRMPTSGTSMPKGVYTLDEMGDVLRAVRGSVIEPAVILMGLGSCRVGESLGVMLSEVELREVDGVPVALAPIVRQVDRGGKVLDDLKNTQSRRTAAVPGPPALRLSSIAADLSSQGLVWLCDDGCGSPISQQVLGRVWSKMLDGAGVERHPVRNLRNSWATNSRWTLGIDPSLIDRMMGHVGGSVTERHYDRPDAEMFAEAVATAYKSHPFADTWDI